METIAFLNDGMRMSQHPRSSRPAFPPAEAHSRHSPPPRPCHPDCGVPDEYRQVDHEPQGSTSALTPTDPWVPVDEPSDRLNPAFPDISRCGQRFMVWPAATQHCVGRLSPSVLPGQQVNRWIHREMSGKASPGGAQRFLSAFSGISPHFRTRRHLLHAQEYRREMANRFSTWNEVTGLTTAA
jgi:hypothetical protein